MTGRVTEESRGSGCHRFGDLCHYGRAWDRTRDQEVTAEEPRPGPPDLVPVTPARGMERRKKEFRFSEEVVLV